MFEHLKTMLSRGLGESVIRRALTLLAFTLPATLLNLGFTYSASHLLEAEAFGIFYTAITAINILFAPAVVVNLFFSRFVATIFSGNGLVAAQGAFPIVLVTLGRWLGIAGLASIAVILVLGGAGGMFSPGLGILIVVIVVTSYLAECGRVILQGERKFFWLGVYTLAWMLLRFVFGIAGLWLFHSVWGALAGVVISGPAAFLLFFGVSPFFRRQMATNIPDVPKFREIIPFAIGFAVFAAAAHADIFLAYLILAPAQLGAYSASSVLPKGLLMVTLPIVQLAFPLMVGSRVEVRPDRSIMFKGLALTGAVSLSGGVIIALASDPVCSSDYGFASCDGRTMIIAAFAMLPFGILRFLISVDFSAHKDWLPSAVLVPVLFFLGIGSFWVAEPSTLATNFAFFSLAVLLPYCVLRLATADVWARKPKL